jgi:hypothetical protein
MASSVVRATAAGTRVASLPELVGNIFNNLDYFDLLRVQQVCQRWRDCVLQVKELQRVLYKAPIALVGNPHFRRRIQQSVALRSRNGEFFDYLHRKLEVAEAELSQSTFEYCALDLDARPRFDMGRHTSGLRRVLKRSLGREEQWPASLKEYDCSNCRTLHNAFVWSNVHPILRFLESIPFICVKGHDQVVCLSWMYREAEGAVGGAAQYASFQSVAALCVKLNDVYTDVQQSRMENELCIQPAVSIVLNQMCLQDSALWNFVAAAAPDTKVTLGKLLPDLILCCRRMLQQILLAVYGGPGSLSYKANNYTSFDRYDFPLYMSVWEHNAPYDPSMAKDVKETWRKLEKNMALWDTAETTEHKGDWDVEYHAERERSSVRFPYGTG